jgi:membrane-associated protease RseP (regulator of RpoE activity)
VCIVLIIYFNRKKFDIQAKVIALYRTSIGVKFIERFVKNKEKLIKTLGVIGIFLGYIGVLAIFYFLFDLLINTLKAPAVMRVAPILPGAPVVGLGIKFPLIIGWISLLIIIIIHEASHGIVAKAFKQKIQSTGFAFFGPIPGAFVEIDEKKLAKQPAKVQLSVFAAGPNSNIITSLIFFAIFSFLLIPWTSSMLMPRGIEVTVNPGLPANLSGLHDYDVIVRIDNVSIESIDDFKGLGVIQPNTTHVFYTSDGRKISITARENPENKSIGQFGINVYQKSVLKNPTKANKALYTVLQWGNELFFWLFLIGFNIGLINFLPIFITDGARILQITLNKIIKNQAKSKKIWLFINRLSLAILLLIFIIPILTGLWKGILSIF